MDPSKIKKLLSETRMVRKPKRLLSTFGATRTQYHLVSPVEDLADKTRLREGWVVSQKPKILTAQVLRDRFEGFGEDAGQFMEWLSGEFHDVLRALEYEFKNKDLKTRVLSQSTEQTTSRIVKDLEDRNVAEAAVIECPDAAWSLALMHYTLDSAARSFQTNVQDLENHGLFDPGSNEKRRRLSEVERLFDRAKRDPDARKLLGLKLREYGLFEELEDRFLGLFR